MKTLGVLLVTFGFMYYYMLHISGYLFYSDGYNNIQYLDTVLNYESILLFSVTFWALVISRLPIYWKFLTFSWLKYNRLLILTFVLFLFLLLIVVTQDPNWIFDSRRAYQYSRSGYGIFYVAFIFSVAVLFVKVYSASNKYRLLWLVVILALSFFTGSKGIVFSFILAVMIIKVMNSNGYNVFYIYISSLVLGVALFIVLLNLGYFGRGISDVVLHLDAVRNSVAFFSEYVQNNDAQQQVVQSTQTKSIILNKILQVFTGAELPSFHVAYFQQEAQLGHYAAHLSSTYLYTSGVHPAFWPILVIFTESAFVLKLALLFKLAKDYRYISSNISSVFVIVLIYQPYLKFVSDLLIIGIIVVSAVRLILRSGRSYT